MPRLILMESGNLDVMLTDQCIYKPDGWPSNQSTRGLYRSSSFQDQILANLETRDVIAEQSGADPGHRPFV